MNSLTFFKLEGAGNDFVALDNRETRFSSDHLIAMTPKLCDRRFGIGADGLLVLNIPSDPSLADYTMIYRNADGSDAGMCGNGGRCIALLAHRLGFPASHSFDVHGRVYRAEVESGGNPGGKNGTVASKGTGRVVSDVAQTGRVILHFPVQTRVEELADQDYFRLTSVHTGTDHITTEVAADTLQDASYLRENGKFLRNDARFSPRGTNVNFYAPAGPGRIRMVTYERGVEDLTLACGTGALASAITWHHFAADSKPGNIVVQVQCDGGLLEAGFRFDENSKNYDQLTLKGPARFVFEGSIRI